MTVMRLNDLVYLAKHLDSGKRRSHLVREETKKRVND